MPKSRDTVIHTTPKFSDCLGGRSWHIGQSEPHPPGKVADIYCYRCKTRMGCSNCCERADQLLCLECHNWATKSAIAKHGNVVPSEKHFMVRTDEGWISKHPLKAKVEQLYREGIKL